MQKPSLAHTVLKGFSKNVNLPPEILTAVGNGPFGVQQSPETQVSASRVALSRDAGGLSISETSERQETPIRPGKAVVLASGTKHNRQTESHFLHIYWSVSLFAEEQLARLVANFLLV